MKISNIFFQQAKQAKDVAELASIAKENGVTLSEDEAAEYFAKLHKSGELADDELNSVAGAVARTAAQQKAIRSIM